MAREVIHSLHNNADTKKQSNNTTSTTTAPIDTTSFPISPTPSSTFPVSHTAISPIYKEYSWANSIYRFWGSNDIYRNRSFKLFPRMCKCSWAIKAAVGNKPALIGNNKLQLGYTRGKNYLEVDIDLSSSSIATHILGMVSIL